MFTVELPTQVMYMTTPSVLYLRKIDISLKLLILQRIVQNLLLFVTDVDAVDTSVGNVTNLKIWVEIKSKFRGKLPLTLPQRVRSVRINKKTYKVIAVTRRTGSPR